MASLIDSVLREEEEIQGRREVDPIDRIPDVKYDKDKLIAWLFDQREAMLIDRNSWMKRQRDYLSQWDDYITSTRLGPWENSASIHLPLSMEKIKAIHARLKEAILAIRPWWIITPIEYIDAERIKTIDIVMRWACSNYVNHYKGIEPVLDDWIWDFCATGWGVVKRRWELVQRNAITVKPITDEQRILNAQRIALLGDEMGKAFPDVEKVAKETKELLTFFDGPVIETIPHEDILFPGSFQDVSDLNQPNAIFHDFTIDESTLNTYAEQGYYDKKVAKNMLKGSSEYSGARMVTGVEAHKYELKRAADDNQGVQTIDSNAKRKEFNMSEACVRYDIDEDGIAEELVITIDLNKRDIARLTYLDRSTQTGKRPFHKIDFIRRPRRAYSIGLLELLYPINSEMDAIHNMRLDFGTISNIPFFFYRAASSIKGDKIKLEPGTGYPLEDVNDVSFPRLNGGTNFGNQEESNLDRWADRVSSINVMNQGLPSERVGASRTASGMQALLNEGNMNINVILSRLKRGWGEVLTGLLADLQERMPNETVVRVLGANGTQMFDGKGNPLFKSVNRSDIAGRVDFMLMANSQNMNRELDKQNSMQRLQLMLNPLMIQTGIVTPVNLYHALKCVFEKEGVYDIDNYLTQPANQERPLSLEQEIAYIRQGLMPRVVMNDDHEGKLASLEAFSQEPSFVEGIRLGSNSPHSIEMLGQTIKAHQGMLQAIQAQAQMQNQTGLQISPSAGARMTGQVGETGRPLPEENVIKGQPPINAGGQGGNDGQTG